MQKPALSRTLIALPLALAACSSPDYDPGTPSEVNDQLSRTFAGVQSTPMPATCD